LSFALTLLLGFCAPPAALAQTAGEGAIEGSILDSSGATVSSATVVATNVNTGSVTTRPVTSSGFFSITPLIPGKYTVEVTAPGFQKFKQENLIIDSMRVTGLNVHLKVGATSETITVTDAPPALDTTNATLGGTVENEVYTALPIMLQGSGGSNQQRDITQFSNLLPGAQVPPGGRSSIIGGTAQRLGEVYVDGLPLTTANAQGDNRPVYNVVPLEAIDQVQVVTSGFSAEYQGAGLENYSTKSGTNKYSGSVFEYVRNTIFDAWGFSAKPGGGNTVTSITTTGTCPTGQTLSTTSVGVCTGPGPKTPEHQNEYGFAVGGPISIPHLFNGHDKLFFFTTFDKFHSYQGVNFTPTSVPTTLMRQGNFSELLSVANGGVGNTAGVNYPIYDPTTEAACTAHNTGGALCRYQYGYGAPAAGVTGAGGAPIKTGTPNVIPASELSPITAYMAQALPAPTNPTTGVIQNNYLGGTPTGYSNYIYSGRVDYVLSDKHRLIFLLTGGNRHAIPYTGSTGLPYPYLSSTLSTVAGHFAEMEDDYTITPHLVNQFKYGFMNFGGPPVKAPTQGTMWAASAAGITGLPAGQASQDFPNTTFSGNANNPTNWVGNDPSVTTVTETYEMVDNIQFVKKSHAMNFGAQYQWLEINADPQDTGSYQLPLTWSSNDTALPTGATTVTGSTGYSYASFLIGAVNASNVTQQPFSLYGGRFHNFSPYFQDDWKITPSLTLNIGLRWDYMPSYQETADRMTFLNPNIANPVTGNMGSLQFAGTYGGPGVSCNCHNLVNTWYKNFGPRASFAWSMDDKTVMRGGYALLYSHAGGVGGASGNNGTGSAGFSTSTSTPSYGAGTAPSFYLNTNPAFPAGANSNYGGPGFTVVPPPAISAISQTTGTGFYLCSGQTFGPCNGSTTAFGGTGAGIAYADPYLGDRAPEISFFNFGMEREITNNITISVNYAGTQSHFLAGTNLRGLQSGQINPAYLTSVGNANLVKVASTANLAAIQTTTGVALPVPYSSYTAAANTTAGTANTVLHMLTWMPQYNGTTDTFGDVANANYNAMEISLTQRPYKGLTYTVNYTYSRNIDDAGTSRSGWAIPSSVTSDRRAWVPDRIDRALSVNNLPELLTVFGVYKLPFGKDGIGAGSHLVRVFAGSWQVSEIFQYASGLPLPIVGTAAATSQSPGQGTYMPDFNPNFHGSPRINGKWGQGVTAATLGTLPYLQGYIPNTIAGNGTASNTGATAAANAVACGASVGPFCNAQNNNIGNLTRTAPYGIRGPNVYRLTMSASRTFDIVGSLKFVFRVDCANVTNHTTFGNNAQNNQIGVNVNSATFGTLGFASADARAFQFSGRLNF
jgi:hypothetical protein